MPPVAPASRDSDAAPPLNAARPASTLPSPIGDSAAQPFIDGEPAAQTLLGRYLANLAALYRRNPALAVEIEKIPFAQIPRIETARDGAATVRLAADDGQSVYAHSRYAPQEEAARTVAALAEPENPTFIVAGGGLGYVWDEIENRFDHPVVIVMEPDLALLKAALWVRDHSAALAAGRLTFLTRADKRAVHDMLTQMNADVMLGVQFVTLPLAKRRGAAFQAEMHRLIADYVAYGRIQITTLVKNARVTCRNIALNLRDYVRHPGIDPLRGAAAGWPAIVVAAGPSLARQLDQLVTLRDRAVIIAAQTVFKLLLAKRCPPHFVTSLDFHEMSADFFRGVSDAGGCTLVAEPKAHASVLDAFPGPRRLLAARFADDLLRDAASQHAPLKAGSTVAHLSFYLAQFLGCDPIILVGQDLCYSEGLYYPPGMPIEDVWRPEMGRFCTPEMKQWERIVRSRPILRTITDVHGRSTYTDEQLFTYAEQFQADFAASPARIIHAGEAGARLSGTTVSSLGAAAEQFCGRPLPAALLTPERIDVAANGQMEKAAAALRQRCDEIAQMTKICDEMLTLLDELVQLVDRPNEFNRRLARVDELRHGMQQFDRTYKLVTDAAQLAELRRFRADRQIGGAERDHETAQTARRRLQRDREFVASVRDGCVFLADLLPQALDRLLEERA